MFDLSCFTRYFKIFLKKIKKILDKWKKCIIFATLITIKIDRMKVKRLKIDYTYYYVSYDDFVYDIQQLIIKNITCIGCSIYKIVAETPDKCSRIFINKDEDSLKIYSHYIEARDFVIKSLEMKKEMINDELQYWKSHTKY